jgi:hypothetical protein
LPIPGKDGQPFDVVGFILAVTLFVAWVFAKWRPHPVLFLVDSIWFLLFAGRLIFDVFVEGSSKGWLVLVAFAFGMVFTGLRHFSRFRGTTIPRR